VKVPVKVADLTEAQLYRKRLDDYNQKLSKQIRVEYKREKQISSAAKLDLKNRGPIELSAFGKDVSRRSQSLNRAARQIKEGLGKSMQSFVAGAQQKARL
jgi:hypothetical protein